MGQLLQHPRLVRDVAGRRCRPEYADSKLILRPTRQIPWRQLQYLTIGATDSLLGPLSRLTYSFTCIVTSYSCSLPTTRVAKHKIIKSRRRIEPHVMRWRAFECVKKYNHTGKYGEAQFYDLRPLQNISVWQGLHDHEDLVVMNPSTTYIKNGKYIYRQVPNRQNLPVLNEINGTGYAHSSKLTFGTNAGPIFKFGPHDESGKPGRMEYDGTELIFRVTLGMTLKPGDNITLMLPYFSNSPNPYNFRDQGVDKYGRIGDEVFIYDACSEEPSERSALCNRTQNHNYDLLNMFDLTKDTRAKAHREGYTPIGGGDLVNSHGDGEFNLRDLHELDAHVHDGPGVVRWCRARHWCPSQEQHFGHVPVLRRRPTVPNEGRHRIQLDQHAVGVHTERGIPRQWARVRRPVRGHERAGRQAVPRFTASARRAMAFRWVGTRRAG